MAHGPQEFATALASMPVALPPAMGGPDVVPVVSHSAATRVLRGGEMR